MRKSSNNLLKAYESEDFVLRLKAEFIKNLCVILLIFLPALIIYMFVLKYLTPFAALSDSFSIVLPALLAFFIISFAFYLLIKGYFSISSHIIISVCLVTTWTVMAVDLTSETVNRLDTIAFIIGVLTMTPLIVSKQKKAIIAYSLINIIILFIFMLVYKEQFGISDNVLMGFIGDNSISIIFVAIISYNIFTINRRALDEAAHEISERKEIEKTLKKSEKRYRLLANNIKDVIWVSNLDLKIIYITKSIIDIRGFTPDEAMEQSLEETLTPDSLEMALIVYEEKFKKALKNEINPDYSVMLELEQYCKDGSTIWTEVKMLFLYDDTNKPSEILGVTRDITERKKTEEMMIQSEKMIIVGELAAGMAHEINNPLASILQNLQILQKRISTDIPENNRIASECGINIKTILEYMEKREISTLIETVKDSGMRAAEIVTNLLSFSRKEENDHLQNDLSEILDKAVDLAEKEFSLQKQFDFLHIEIIREYENDLPLVPCFESKILQVIINLLKNGAQAMGEKFDSQKESEMNEKPQFILRLKKESSIVSIEIEDNGPGMPENIKRHIFEPFFTTKNIGDGTGLGLFISYFIITQNHNGQMLVESTLGVGTRFIIKLPV